MNQNQAVPREIIKWLDKLDLSYSVRNVRRDLSNGFIVAEILSRYKPEEISIYSFDNGLKLAKKKDNWEQISKYLGKKDFQLLPEQYEPIYYCAENAAIEFLEELYEFLTKNKINRDSIPKIKRSEETPSYAKPTAANLAKNNELVRIVDDDRKAFETKLTILKHNQTLREQKQDSNIIQYLVLKRKAEMQEKLRQEEEEILERKRKYNIDQSQQPEVKEIQLKSWNTSTGKQDKQQQGVSMEVKGILEYFNSDASTILKSEANKKTFETLKIDTKKQPVQDLFNKCDEIIQHSQKTLATPDILDKFILHYQQEQLLDQIVDTLNNNFSDFKKFFFLFVKPLDVFPQNSQTYVYILDLIKKVASELCAIDPQTVQLMFETILLKELLQIIIKNPTKRQSIIELFYFFCAFDCQSRMYLIKKIQTHLSNDYHTYVAVLSYLIVQDYGDDPFSDELYYIFKKAAVDSLFLPSPFTRTNGLKIIYHLSIILYEPILPIVHHFSKMVNDPWWEINAQILTICSSLLLFISRQQTAIDQDKIQGQQSPKDEDLKSMKSNASQEEQLREYQLYLIDITLQLFRVNVSQNILKIGLTYLASVLISYPDLCDRYLEILLEIYDNTREQVLMCDPPEGMDEGQVVDGYASFKYKLTSAPQYWYSVGIAKSLDKYTRQENIIEYQKVHLDILIGCLYQDLESKDADTWTEIYENIKTQIFISLCDSELCLLASEILKKLFLFPDVQSTLMQTSLQLFLDTLQHLYHPDIEPECRENILLFFQYLISQDDIFEDYIFQIIKNFSENFQNLFLQSNLIEFMNELAKSRRNKSKEMTVDYLPQ